MEKYNIYSLKIKYIICFSLLLNLSCTDNKKDIQSIFYKYHLKNSQTNNSKNEIKIILSKNLNSKFNGVLYRIKNTNKLYFGIINVNNDIVSITRLKGKETASIFNNYNCIVRLDSEKNIIPEKEDNCFTFFIGEFPYQEYSEIELEWNCSKTDLVSENLIEGKYFFFFKEGLNNIICNLKARNNNEQNVNIIYNIKDGSFIKKPTHNNGNRCTSP